MIIKEFLKQKLLSILLMILVTISIELFLLMYQLHIFIYIYIAVIIPFAYFLILTYEYIRKKNYYNELLNNIEKLDQKYLISELVKTPNFIEGKITNEILIDAEKSMIEHVNEYKNINKEYEEYIEMWIHEIKTPIATSKMLIENNQNEITKSIDEELDKIDSFVEQALYYAKSNTVGEDYIIKKTQLKNIVNKVIMKNKKQFINHKIGLEIHIDNIFVYSDFKWLEFILQQIITNSIKYAKKENANIRITAEENKNNVILSIIDNGIGIEEKELKKVFEKGYTGTNGRKINKSTGIGLYLCQKLCKKLGHNISLQSKLNQWTKVQIYFPRNSFTII